MYSLRPERAGIVEIPLKERIISAHLRINTVRVESKKDEPDPFRQARIKTLNDLFQFEGDITTDIS